MPADEIAEVAEIVLGRLACPGGLGGPNQSWTLDGVAGISHVATFPDRDTGEPHLFEWSTECLLEM